MHFSVLATIRNGITMCKFVVYHSEEFDNPVEMFIFAFMVVLSNVLGQVTNAFVLLEQHSVQDIIAKFVTFKILFQIQDYYLRARSNFKVKKAVADPLIIIPNAKKIFGNNRKSRFIIKQIEIDRNAQSHSDNQDITESMD